MHRPQHTSVFPGCGDTFAMTKRPLITWWRHQMETFSALLAICAGSSPVPGEFPTQRPVTRSFGVFFDLRLNKWLSKQSWGWRFETLLCPLWRQCNEKIQCAAPASRPCQWGFYIIWSIRPSIPPDLTGGLNLYTICCRGEGISRT